MKKILIESYKTFYTGVIVVLWSLAILFAILQNGFLSQFVIKNTLPYIGASAKEVRGGVFGVLTLEGVTYKDIAKCDEISFKADILTLFDTKKLKISLLDIKGLRLDRQKLQDELSKSVNGGQRHIDSVEIENASVELLDQNFGDAQLKSVRLRLSSLGYDFKRLVFEYSLEAKTNIVDTKCTGYFKDFNYTAKGELRASGGTLVNRLVDDVDFDFNALGDTQFSLHGDTSTLNAEFETKDSGVFYKYGVDAKISQVKSTLFMDFAKPYINVSSEGTISSRYGTVDTRFLVLHDGKTTYKGTGVVKKFDYIPLGIFKDDIKILASNNGSVSFEGDMHKLKVKAGKTTARGTIRGEPLEIVDSDTDVYYDFDKDSLKVDVKAVANSKYGSFDCNTTVLEDDKNKTSFEGVAYIKDSKNLPFKDSLLATSSVRFTGNEDKLHAELASKYGKLLVFTNDYQTYKGKLDAQRLSLSEVFGIRPKIGKLSFKTSASGVYEHKKDALKIDAWFNGAEFMGKNAVFSKLSISKTKNIYSVSPFEFSLASLSGKLQSSISSAGAQHISLRTNGMDASYDMDFDKQAKLTARVDMSASGVWLEELFGIKKNSFSGTANIDIHEDFGSGKTTFKASSDRLLVIGSDIAPLKLSGSYSKEIISLDSLEFMFKQAPYKLDKKVQVSTQGNEINADGISLGEKIFLGAHYKDGMLKVDYKFKDFDYYDPRLAKFRLGGSGWVVLKDDKLFVNGELETKNLELFYSSRGAKIAKDKDIKVIKPKNFIISDDWLFRNSSINLRIANNKTAKLKTKEANATLVPDVIYYKDFGRKGNFVGLVKVLGGNYSLEGRNFKLEGGEVTLMDGEEDNPYIDLTLRLDEADISIFVGAKGFASAPKLTFWSKPALSEREIMSYLIFGIDDGFGFDKSGVKSDYTTKAIGALSNMLSRDIANEFGVKLDKIEVTPSEYQSKDGRLTTGTKVEVGKKVTKDLTVIYKNDAESGVALQYRINKNIGVETESRNKGSSVELFYKQDY